MQLFDCKYKRKLLEDFPGKLLKNVPIFLYRCRDDEVSAQITRGSGDNWFLNQNFPGEAGKQFTMMMIGQTIAEHIIIDSLPNG